MEGIKNNELLFKAFNILLLNFDLYPNANYDVDFAAIIEKCESLLSSNKILFNDFNESFCYTYLLYTVFVFENAIEFGMVKENAENKIKDFTKTNFFQRLISMLCKLLFSEDKNSKHSTNIKHVLKLEQSLKWLFFYTLKSRNIGVINTYLKIINDIYDFCTNNF